MSEELRKEIAAAIKQADNSIEWANPYTYYETLADAVMPIVEREHAASRHSAGA